MTNPLLDFSGLPRFDEIRPEHVAPAIDRLLCEAEVSIKALERVSPATWEGFVVPLDNATERVDRAWTQVKHLEAVASTPALRAAYNEALPKIARYMSGLAQDEALFAQFRALAEAPEFAAYDEARRMVIENALRAFRLGGAQLPPGQRQRVGAIKEELAGLAAKFSQNVLDATDAFGLFVDDEARLAGIPEDVLSACRMAAEKAGRPGWKLGLHMPVCLPVLAYAEDRELRHALYRANVVRASDLGDDAALDNGDCIQRILALRAEMAGLLGFSCYAEYSLATKMADTPDEVLAFLRDMAVRARPHAEQDRIELEAFSRRNLGLETLEAWDVAFASEKLKQARYRLSAQDVKPYFTEQRVLAGLFELIHALYGLNVEPDIAPVWHEDVRFYRLADAQGRTIGQFYLDLYAREGKRSGAWMDECRGRRVTGGEVQTPVAFLVCNFGKGTDGKPATFGHREVITLFHEMGHGLHLLLTRIGELGVSGINGVEWDAVELPSQFMENFCWEWDRVCAMSGHVETGDKLPRELFDKMLAARNFQSGMAAVRQLEMGIFDMLLHAGPDANRNPDGEAVLRLLWQVREEVAVNLQPAWNRFPHQFSHIFAGGYAAGYYSYKWAEVLSADAYAAFEEAPARQAETGAKFREEILSRGGSRRAIENFRAFRGRAPRMDALLRHNGMSN